jgi:hypothetical protein
VTFPHRAQFLYLQQQFGSAWYWDRLAKALIDSRSAYGFAIAALRQRDGIVPAKLFPIVCGAPLKQAKQISADTVLARLSQAGLLTTVSLPGVGDCVAFVQAEGHYDHQAERLRARLITEDITLMAVKEWLRNLGIASFGKVATRAGEALPKVGTFAWDLSAPSYLAPLVRPQQDGQIKNGFVTCDIHLGEPMTRAGVTPFVRKCATLRGLHKVGDCLQILVADRFDKPAFQYLKSNGIIPATPANLFGDEVAEGLRQLTSVLENAAHAIIDPAKFDDLFSKLGKIEGAANQLRGTLFEYLAAEMARKTIASDVKLNRIFKVAGKGQAEADVVAIKDNHALTVIECKGYSPRATIPDDLFKRWLQHNVPICYHAIREHPDWKTLPATFEFWTTAPLSAESMALFTAAKAAIKPTRYTLALRINEELHAVCKATKDTSLIVAFENHFMKVGKPADDWMDAPVV